MRFLLLVVLLFLIQQSYSQLLIRNTTIVDVENKKLLAGQDVLVENGLITATGKKLKAPAGTEIIDGAGKYLMPGLVDAHIHFFQSGSIYTRPDAIDLRKIKPYEQEIAWTQNNMESLLRRYTSAGITTVIDVGASVNLLQQRDSFRNKSYAPAVIMTGPLLTTYEPPTLKDLGDNSPFYLMKSVEDARNYVRKQLPYRPDFIKVWYIALGANADSAARANLPLVQEVIREAHKNNLRVAVHATEQTTAMLAVEAGADFLVHDIEDRPVSTEFVQLLKAKGTVICPTLVVVSNYVRSLGQRYQLSAEDYRYAPPAPLNSMFDIAVLSDTALANGYKRRIAAGAAAIRKEDSVRYLNFKKLVDAGVTIATGTDAGNIGTHHVSSYFDELRAMQEAGMDTWQLLQSSTTNGAKAVGRQHEFGLIKKGMRADLLLLSKNPAENINHWQSVEKVINKGTVWNPDSVVKSSAIELADEQLLAYNAHNLEAFLKPYADDVEIYDLSTNKLELKGKEAMRKQYSFLSSIGQLHCKVINRIVNGRFVIDHEEITAENGKFYGVAIYEVVKGKIVRVWFPDRK